jgi:hypothetical protein
MKALVTRAQEFRVRFKERQAAARLIQATYRKIRQKRQMLNLSISVKSLIKRKVQNTSKTLQIPSLIFCMFCTFLSQKRLKELY